MSMDCDNASKLISRRIDADISPEESEALDRHLSECAACRNEWREQEQLRAAMAALPDPSPPSGMDERLRRVLAAETAPERGSTFHISRVLSLAAILLLAVAVSDLVVQLNAARAESRRLASALETAREKSERYVLENDAPRIIPSETEVVQQIQGFRAVRDYVGGSMRWMVTDGDQVEIGMSGGSNGHPAAASERETIVLNFEYRDLVRGKSPRVVSNPEFVLFSGDEVSVRLKGRSPDEPMFRYRVVAEKVIGGDIRAEVSFANEAMSRDDSNGSLVVRTVLTPGKPILVGAGGTGDRRWELYLWGVARPMSYRGPDKESKPL